MEAVVVALTDEVAGTAEEPAVAHFEGRPAVAAFFVELFGVGNPGDWRLVPTRANGLPAAANYVRVWGEQEFRATTLDVLRIENGRLIEITTFDARTFPAFGLPLTWTGPELTQ
jgi:predicted SnoaL-like aldol condensation-catalyzing enzyme